jgi:hypothetical protein
MTGIIFAGPACGQDDDNTRNVLKQGLVGAGVGAISSGASGGDAGKGALIGAGTAVIGSALLDAVTGPSTSSRGGRRAAPADDEEYYYADEPEEYYEEPPQESGTGKVLKQGLVGAGVGAISAGASGGDAGKGALIGAGTTVIGNALLDTITQPPAQRRGKVYKRIPRQNVQVEEAPSDETTGSRKKIIRKYDENGKVVSEEEIYY